MPCGCTPSESRSSSCQQLYVLSLNPCQSKLGSTPREVGGRGFSRASSLLPTAMIIFEPLSIKVGFHPGIWAWLPRSLAPFCTRGPSLLPDHVWRRWQRLDRASLCIQRGRGGTMRRVSPWKKASLAGGIVGLLGSPFCTIRGGLWARIALDSLAPDPEPRKGGISKELSVMEDTLHICWKADEARILRVSVNSFLEHLSLVVETMDLFGPPVV
ncbi:EKC/KEOPS complex subunit LAGE3 isoform X1 [Sceloporus undulatus]|uniref:EKC/KEOPS complex subunit LAGE3 isoform X1 n=1 Tax=Sceloporus undulatus TaxID=8520 RepID=UPI001C4A9064|nr:EKC/KEOPS complex subunit LAGE3 isoform X1 [Sceloporus undulatus]